MPQKTKHSTTARRTRKSSHPGNKRKKPGCKGCCRSKTHHAGIIANSLFALTLNPVNGFKVLQQKGERWSYRTDTGDDLAKMYSDLLEALQRAAVLLKKGIPTDDLLINGQSMEDALHLVVTRFKDHILPNGYEMNIDRENYNSGDYYFSIYKQVDFPWAWHIFSIKPVVHYLKKRNKKLHKLFIDAMSLFYTSADINTWFESGFGYCDFVFEDVEEYIANHYDFDSEEEEWEARGKLNDIKACYETGEAHKYEMLLRKSKCTLPQLKRKLSQFSKRSIVVKWLYQLVSFLELPGSMENFMYRESEFWEDGGVTLDRQVTIIWDEDFMFDIEGEALDADASGAGVMPPELSFEFRKDTKSMDLSNLKEKESWMHRLSMLQDNYYDVIKTILK